MKFMKYIQTILALMLFFSIASRVDAKYDPRTTENNKVGIHILNESEITEAAKLVNSTGGNWGYVTLVIRDDERDVSRWESFFNELKVNRLIPIVRLATSTQNGNWSKPGENSAKEWKDFLDQLPWPVLNRYIVVFNEPNHAGEWGGELRPDEYAMTLDSFITELGDSYFMLPAGLDLAAPNSSSTMSSVTYMEGMENKAPGIFSRLDGWTSHSYPNPGFSGSPYATGKTSIRGFEWEITYLKTRFDVENLPVFITETGWARSSWLTPELVAEYYDTAFNQIWTHPDIVAITPFLLRYDDAQFSKFAFAIPKAYAAENISVEYYPQYSAVQSVVKQNGYPLGINLSPLGKLTDAVYIRRNSMSLNLLY